MKRIPKRIAVLISGASLVTGAILGMSAHADIQDLIDADVFNELEARAAVAALRTYTRLIALGCEDDLLTDPGAERGNACTGNTFTLFSNVREIIHTANDITNDGPSAFSLRSTTEGLGFTLRWTAAEEYAAQGSLSNEFVGGQVSSLATRLTALRLGAAGFNVIGLASGWQSPSSFSALSLFEQHDARENQLLENWMDYGYLDQGQIEALKKDQLVLLEQSTNKQAQTFGPNGLVSHANGESRQYSPWGGFLNVDLGSGKRAPTDLEDAFDFENTQVTLGIDYRLNTSWVLGAIIAWNEQEVDFDGSQSIVEGQILSDGNSVMPFAMFTRGAWFVSGSLGMQRMTFDSERAIRYPSFSEDVDSANTLTVATTDAAMTSLFFETGYSFQWQKVGLEPFVNVKYSDVAIDGFTERDVNNDAFDLVVSKQNFTTQELTFGAKLQYTLTPSYGVFVPFISVEFVNQSEDAPRFVDAYYAQDVTGDSAFNVPTEALDSTYTVSAIGLSSVLRGGRERRAGGPIGGDLQGFFLYKTYSGLEGFDIDLYSFGLRYTF